MALDSIHTPFGETADALGGSAVYFSVAGALLHRVHVVGVVGDDYPVAELDRLAPRGIDWSGVERAAGESFRWKGEELLKAVLEATRKMVVVLMSGRPMTVGWTAENAPAILEAWHGGSQAGHAIADVLFGDYNPSGKLPVAFPRHVGQLPMTYAHKNTERPGPEPGVTWSAYRDVSNEPLYPFGFGLSYTTFSYSEPKVSAAEIGRDGSVVVTTTLTNTGKRAGTEVVQLYVRDLVGSVTQPVRELKGFQKIDLAPGQSREVSFTLKAADLAFYTAAGKWEAEPGAFRVFVGGNSRDLQAGRFTLR